MTSRRHVVLPVVQRPPLAQPVSPAAGRLEAGWELRFVAEGARVAEMVGLYQQLGFDVEADPVPTGLLADGCSACFADTQVEYRSIYTRRPVGSHSDRSTRMSEAHPTQVLREEHRLILGVADALDVLLRAGGNELDYEMIGKCVRFIRLFADACHHGKEEDLLFPALEMCGMSRDAGPIAVMLYEHRLGREHAAAMALALPGAEAGSEDDRARLVHAGRGYVDLIRNHIVKEDNVLFDMADQMVTGGQRDRLCSEYDGTCDHSFDGCTKAQLETLGQEILGA